MTSPVGLSFLGRSSWVTSLAVVLLVVGATQASAEPGQTRFKITWSA